MFNCLNTTCCVYFLQFDFVIFNPLSANPTKWSNTLKQFVGIFAWEMTSQNSQTHFENLVEFDARCLKCF